MEVRLKSIELQNYKGVQAFTAAFGQRTEINGQNAVGKSTVMDAYFDIMTGKMADGSEPDNVRPHNKEGVDIDHIPVIRGIEIEVDGNPVKIEKITEQKWRKPRSQTEEVFDGNVTSYRIDGFDKKQKDFLEYMAQIGKPEMLLMCSNPIPFISTVRKSTAEARKVLEKLSGFDTETFLLENPQYSKVADVVKKNPVETVLKQLRKNLSAQNKARDKARTNLEYEKNRDVSKMNTGREAELMGKSKLIQNQLDAITSKADKLIHAAQAYSEMQSTLYQYKEELEELAHKLLEGTRNKRQAMLSQLKELEFALADINRQITFTEREIERRKEEATRLNDELVTERARYLEVHSEFDESKLNSIKEETFDESTLICPTCGQILPEEKQAELRAKFEQKKQARIAEEESRRETFLFNKKKQLDEIAKRGNSIAASFKNSKNLVISNTEKLQALQQEATSIKEQIEVNRIERESIKDVDLSADSQYREKSNAITELQNKIDGITQNPLEELNSLHSTKGTLNRELFQIQAQLKVNGEEAKKKELMVAALEFSLKAEAQKCADIEKDIDMLLEFSRVKNQVLASKINPHFKHFQFEFLEYTNEGNPVETCRMVCKGTNYFDGLNGGDKKLVEIDLCRGFQEIQNLYLPIWSDEANTIDSWRIPEDMKQQLIVIERTDDKNIVVKEI